MDRDYTKEEVRESELVTKKAGIRNEALYKKEKQRSQGTKLLL